MLEEMLAGYIECALWSSTDGEDFIDENYSESDLSEEARESMRQDCAKFIEANRAHIEAGPGEASQAGHDFWLTRCGHGTGFWDRDDNVWSKAARDAMDEYSRAAGNRDLEIGDDGKIHIM